MTPADEGNENESSQDGGGAGKKRGGPGSRFVNFDPRVMEQFLQEVGTKIQRHAQARNGKGGSFRRIVQGNEIVYVFENPYHPAVRIKVFTSIRASSAHGVETRGAGQDAIKVTAAYEGKKPLVPRKGAAPSTSFGIFKTTHIHRTGSEAAILERLDERLREAYEFTNEWLRNHWQEVTTP